MSGKYDPLSELFDKAKLTGLSNTRSSSTQPPLQFDLSELEESSLEEPELPLDLPKKPVSPPRGNIGTIFYLIGDSCLFICFCEWYPGV